MTGIVRMLDFISQLKENNNRPWFAEHKAEYTDIRRQCLEEIAVLISEIAKFDPQLVGVEPEQCIYRIYRDIRFSADKSPFKTHFGIVLGHGGKKCTGAAYYVHIEPDNCCFCSGVWFPEQPILKFLRRNIFDNIDEFTEIMDAPAFKKQFPGLVGNSLKALPKGYQKDCPRPEIFKMKEYLVQKKYKKSIFESENWQKTVAKDAHLVKPFNDFLNYAFEEMHNQ